MSDTELARSIRKALHDNDYINYNHENNKYIEWLILDILSEYKLLKKAVQWVNYQEKKYL